MHSRIPRQGFTYLATPQTAGQPISPSRAAPRVLPARYKFSQMCFRPCAQALAVVPVLCAEELCVLVVWPPPHSFPDAAFPSAQEGLPGQGSLLQSQAREQAASTEGIAWHPASLGCLSSCLPETSTQSVPFTAAAAAPVCPLCRSCPRSATVTATNKPRRNVSAWPWLWALGSVCWCVFPQNQ